MDKYNKFQINNFDDMEWDVIRKGVQRKVFSGRDATVAYNHGARGHEVKPHSHVYEQYAIILEGEGIFSIGGQDYPVKKGSWMVIPSNVEHYLTVTSDEPCVSLDVFTPRRLEIMAEEKSC
ncbi:MAG: cupin domain-containing protein [Clostridiales Family XIII bacterium]|jgi:quercetin dioxygenase-like cupin family protein|nr:cupin domain-containing protein [Clostridiales Family XIII bacterium]